MKIIHEGANVTEIRDDSITLGMSLDEILVRIFKGELFYVSDGKEIKLLTTCECRKMIERAKELA